MITPVKHLGDKKAALKICSACLLDTLDLPVSLGIEGGITDFSLESLTVFSICLSSAIPHYKI